MMFLGMAINSCPMEQSWIELKKLFFKKQNRISALGATRLVKRRINRRWNQHVLFTRFNLSRTVGNFFYSQIMGSSRWPQNRGGGREQIEFSESTTRNYIFRSARFFSTGRVGSGRVNLALWRSALSFLYPSLSAGSKKEKSERPDHFRR